uniref:Uncharacterized protein n=1 Tax=Cannabis sativa TaxID=3483 RepID=A0A803NIE9_CANSA
MSTPERTGPSETVGMVGKVEIADDLHVVPPMGQIVEVEALENRLAYRHLAAARMLSRWPILQSGRPSGATVEVGALVTEQKQGMLQANQQLEEESARQSRFIQNMKAIHDLYMETMERMFDPGPSSPSCGVQP